MSDSTVLSRILEPLRRRVALMVRRAVINMVKDDNPVQVVQIKLFKGECREGVERIQEYGLSTVPLAEGQALAVCVDGECGHEVVVATDDRRYRPVKQPDGSVMLYTHANKKDDADTEHHFHLIPEGRQIHGVGKTAVIEVDETIELRTRDGKNFIRIGIDGIRITEGGGFDNGGSDIRMKGGQIWRQAAKKLINRTEVNRTEIPPTAAGETGGPTMPE